jgi:hypothetical protein
LNHIRSFDGGENFLNENYGSVLEAYLTSAFSKQGDFYKLIENYKSSANKENISVEEKIRAERVAGILETFLRNQHHEIMKFITKRIEMTERFGVD